MPDERWQRVKELIGAALERPPEARAAFLKTACAGDEGLRHEVESLLAARDEAGGFLSEPARLAEDDQASRASPDRSSEATTSARLALGTRLGPYEVLSFLSAGGMGEVYKARDTRLDRTVAIKVLPSDFAADPDRIRRFEQEARAVSKLNHPHICALYDVGQHDGSAFLVMEYLEGESLARRLSKGALPLEEALRHATQIAEALAEAHQQGIVHRDLKPANVMLTRKGAKLLDFGIAKLRPGAAAEEAATATALEMTGEGVIVGTPQYMAPEQLEGKRVDARTDVFAFGVLLYEMVSGRKPFEAPSRAGVIAAILERDPPSLSRFQPLSPPWLEALVRRCLAKQPADRWQSCADLLVHLEAEIGGRPLEDSALDIRRRRVLWMTGAAVALLAVFAVIALAVSSARRWRTASPKPATFSQLTDQPGPELYASLSPDAKSFVYQSRAAGNWDIYFQRVKGKTAVNLTRDSMDDDTQPAFSPDGERVAFRSEREGGGIFLMGATGESVKRLTDFGYNPAWSPDGREIVCSTGLFLRPEDAGTSALGQLFRVDVTAGTKRPITDNAGTPKQPHWSPHGHRIAYWQIAGGQRDIYTVPASGGDPVPVTDDPYVDWNPVWSPAGGGDDAVFLHRVHQLLSRRPSDGVRAADSGLECLPGRFRSRHRSHRRPAGTRDTRLEGGRISRHLARRPVDRLHLAAEARRRVHREDRWHRSSPTDRRHPSGTDAPLVAGWETDRIHVEPERKVADLDDQAGWQRSPTTDRCARQWSGGTVWSPDGARLVGQPLQGGRSFVFQTGRAWKDQSPEPLPASKSATGFYAWSWSADGRTLAGHLVRKDGSSLGVATYSFDSNKYEQIATIGNWPIWLPDSRRLVFHHQGKAYLIDSVTQRMHEVLSVAPYAVSWQFGMSRDGRQIVFTRDATEADVWLMTVE
ncbi:MAG: hypothetical protein DMF77_17005 [Acidobacteria bacterium]|nr:MAG: hypothetical protein DMF77_17005 [Acidobacteriota bacterium]